jgi:putative methionine-R-sulfoxide reductase with GAF domain
VMDVDSPKLDRFDLQLEEFIIEIVHELLKRWD